MFNKNTFGGGFGQPQQQQQPTNSLFGQPQQPQQQTTFGGFGGGATTTGFGAAQNTGTSAFGQPVQQQTSAFGQPSAGGFGAAANTGSAFGQQQPSAFGSTSTSAFGSTTPATTGFGGGGFGTSGTNTTSAFGNSANQTSGGGLFGQRPATGFGQNTTTASTFGQQPQTTTFGGASTSAFGQPTGAGGNQGTAVADFAPTQDRDVTTGINNFFQTITAMPQYKQYSVEELRLQDYNQNRKSSQGASGTTGGFGSTTGGFGSTNTTANTGFGQSTTGGAFGAQQTTGAFGQTQPAATNTGFGAQPSTGGGLFGQAQNTGTSGFGQQQTTNAFGASNTTGGGFGTTAGGFGATGTTTGFGAGANNAPKTFGFGATSQPSTGFGSTTTTTGFGQNTLGNTGFGQANQQTQPTGFGFGQKPAGTTGGFGATTGGFGTTTGGFGATSKPANSFSFNAASSAPTTTTTTGFGSGFGTATSGVTTGGFGATQPAQTGFGATAPAGGLFGAKPATGQTNTLFNTTAQPTTGTTGFSGFGANPQQTTGGFGANTGGGLFGAKPATGGLGTTGGGIFGNTQAGAGTGFGFGNTQQAGTGSFTLPATGGLTSFGTNGLQPGQQPLVATVDKNPYGVNPLFDTSKLQQQGISTTVTTSIGQSGITTQVKTEPTAVPIDGKKVDTTPHYPVSPRVVSKIKLRGFSFNPASKPSSKKATRFNGISDDSILGAEAFSPRTGSNKLVFDQISSNKITELVNKHVDSNKPLTMLDPHREQLAATVFEKTASTSREINQHDSQSKPDHSNNSANKNEKVDDSLVSVASQHGYYCSPTLDVLKAMTKDELEKVDKFIVGRRGYGEVQFNQPVDLTGLNLNEIMGGIVVFQLKSLTIYPDARTKPPIGSGLNTAATVRLEKCFTCHQHSKEPIKDPTHPKYILFIEKLRKSENDNLKFIDYENETGTWVFQVKSF
ncbi:nucleoporin autopeptidase-domain-containing protein [Cunninghamella echinulata]|nr:nucleoporin autopeptidase-domain-containing protein [Cunninghamella echinulata]